MKDRKRTCVIIDDEISSHKILTYYISTFQKLVVRRYNGFDGIRAIEKHHPAIVFLDINIPEMTGLEMLTRMPK